MLASEETIIMYGVFAPGSLQCSKMLAGFDAGPIRLHAVPARTWAMACPLDILSASLVRTPFFHVEQKCFIS